MYIENWFQIWEILALRCDKLLHTTYELTYSSVQYTVNYVRSSSKTELLDSYLENNKLLVHCTWKYARFVQTQLLLSIKPSCNVSLTLILVHFGDDVYVLGLWRFWLRYSISGLYYVWKVNATSDFTRWVVLNVFRKLKVPMGVERIW
jgi:hypothetical protein